MSVAAATRSGRFGEYNYRCACIAQLVEQLTLNQLVPGSNPGAGISPPFSPGFQFSFGPLSSRTQSPKPRPKWSKSSDLQDCKSAKGVIYPWLRLPALRPLLEISAILLPGAVRPSRSLYETGFPSCG